MKKDLIDLATAKAKLAAVAIAALVVGGTAATVSSTSFLPVDSSIEVPASPTPTTTESPAAGTGTEDDGDDAETTDTEATPEATPSASPETEEPATTECPEGLKNHGKYVSSVAKDKSTTGAEHGKAVSEAAKSDCGKKDGTEADGSEDPEGSEDPDDADEADDAEKDKKPKKDKPGKGKKDQS